jgi:agmatinase
MFTADKLAALRARYAGAKAGDVQDPEFRKVSELLFAGTERRRLPYAGVKTFLDLPYRPDTGGVPQLDGLDAAVVGIPMDLGVTHRSGARFGPRAVRGVERIGPYNHVQRIVPAAALRECEADLNAYYRMEYPGDHPYSQKKLAQAMASNPATVALKETNND